MIIDTSLNACQAGIFRDGEPLGEKVEPMQRGHQERLAPMVAELLDEAGITPRALSHVGVTLGPGSFTGLRVGLAFAKGLAAGLGLSLKGIGTLEALGAHSALVGRRVLSVIHGGRDHIYVQATGSSPQAFDPADPLAVDVLTGPAAGLVRDHFPDAEIFTQDWPSLSALAELALASGHDDVTPLYMRDADAVVSTRGIIKLSEGLGVTA